MVCFSRGVMGEQKPIFSHVFMKNNIQVQQQTQELPCFCLLKAQLSFLLFWNFLFSEIPWKIYLWVRLELYFFLKCYIPRHSSWLHFLHKNRFNNCCWFFPISHIPLTRLSSTTLSIPYLTSHTSLKMPLLPTCPNLNSEVLLSSSMLSSVWSNFFKKRTQF